MQHNQTEQSPVSSRKLLPTITQIYSLRSTEGLKPKHLSLCVLLNFFYYCLTFLHSETAIIHMDKTAIRSSDCSYYLQLWHLIQLRSNLSFQYLGGCCMSYTTWDSKELRYSQLQICRHLRYFNLIYRLNSKHSVVKKMSKLIT